MIRKKSWGEPIQDPSDDLSDLCPNPEFESSGRLWYKERPFNKRSRENHHAENMRHLR